MAAGKRNYEEKNIQNNLSRLGKILGEMAERFKAVDCKSIEFTHRRFESYFLLFITKRNMAQLVARLLWEQEVMCSSHIISKQLSFSSKHNLFLSADPMNCIS